jgi:hypothetical protein
VTLEENNPTLRWLGGKSQSSQQQQQQATTQKQQPKKSTTVLLLNGTSIDQSVASFDRHYQWWLDDDNDDDDLKEQQCKSSSSSSSSSSLHSNNRYATTTTTVVLSMELLAEISMEKPGYLQILPSQGPGRTAWMERTLQQQQQSGTTTTRWNKNKWRKRDDVLLEEAPATTTTTTTTQGERLWVTGFSLAGRHGIVNTMDIHDGNVHSISARSKSMMMWPNEICHVPANLLMMNVNVHQKDQKQQEEEEEQAHALPPPQTSQSATFPPLQLQDAILVSDGFLVPGKDRGGIYLVRNPSHRHFEWTVCLTDPYEREPWFYHRACWVDLTGDGRQSILTARAKLKRQRHPHKGETTTTNSGRASWEDNNSSSNGSSSNPPRNNGQLVWLEMPKPHHIDEATGTPLEQDGTTFDPFSARHLPWKEHVLAAGPDVMFAVADLDCKDDTIEILSSQFFDKKVSLHSIQKGPQPRVVFSRDIDNQCGAAFGGILAQLVVDDGSSREQQSHHFPRVVDSGSTVNTLERGDAFSHFLVTSHECAYDLVEAPPNNSGNNISPTLVESKQLPSSKAKMGVLKGGSLFAYRVPSGKRDAWKTEPWLKTTVATGFQVKSQIWNVINPGAPGFCYTFHAHRDDKFKGKRPMIAVAGDCAESAYLFRPHQLVVDDDDNEEGSKDVDAAAKYKLMCEIKCGATVGSIAVGYEDLCGVEQESGYAKIYIPCFEKDKILAFALGSGESEPLEQERVDANANEQDGVGGW